MAAATCFGVLNGCDVRSEKQSSERNVRDVVRVMQVEPPPLLPLLRSPVQAELLTLILLNPDREWTLSELARRVDTHVSTALREVVRAEAAGVVSTRLVGRSRLARAAASPLTGPLTELLLRAFGPRQVVGEELEGVAGVEDAFLFGSWAARYSGEPGRAPADIDVLVLGQPDRDALFEAAERASERLAREVNVTIRGPDPGRRGARTRPSRHRHGQPINRDSRTSPAFGAPPSRLR